MQIFNGSQGAGAQDLRRCLKQTYISLTGIRAKSFLQERERNLEDFSSFLTQRFIISDKMF